MTGKLKTAHDTYCQSMMENMEVASSLFKAYLPIELVHALDWSTLAITDAVMRPTGKKPLYTDITYHIYTHAPKGNVYLHVEQERTIQAIVAERNAQYEAALNLKHLKQGHKKLPLIYHFVVYNGDKAAYPDPADTNARFERHDLLPFFPSIPACPFKLLNLNCYEDATLSTQGTCGLMLLLLKKASKEGFLTWMRSHKQLLRLLTTSPLMIIPSLDYTHNVREEDSEAIVATFVYVYPELNDDIMTAMQKLEARVGEKKTLEIARTMLLKGYKSEAIRDITALELHQIQDLLSSKRDWL